MPVGDADSEFVAGRNYHSPYCGLPVFTASVLEEAQIQIQDEKISSIVRKNHPGKRSFEDSY